MRVRTAALAMACSVALALALSLSACGSSGGDDPGPPHEPTIPPIATVDAADIQLTPVTSTTTLYAISVPPGWEPKGISALQQEQWELRNENLLQADMAVTCEPPVVRNSRTWVAADYIDRDLFYAGVAQNGGSNADPVPGQRFPVSASGIEGEGVTYAVTLPGAITIRQQAVYLVTDRCAWILRLHVYATGDANEYRTLFGRVVGSFQVLPGG